MILGMNIIMQQGASANNHIVTQCLMFSFSSSQPGYYPSYPPHASRNEQWLYGHQNQVTPVHSNVYQVQYPSSSMRAFE